MTQITEMSLYSNQLSGPLPAEWSSMTQITLMRLQLNELSGSLPVEWST